MSREFVLSRRVSRFSIPPQTSNTDDELIIQGGGPLPTEQLNEHGEKLQSIGREIGVTTKRKRRCVRIVGVHTSFFEQYVEF